MLICGGQGRELRARVVDFGLARVLERRDPERAGAGEGRGPSTLMGTPAYMSPEQLQRAPLDARTDQFSFGVALHEALSGRHPFGADEPGVTSARLLARILAGERPRGEAALPAWLRRIVRRCLAPDPAARYPSMRALVRELEVTPARRRRRALLAAGVALALGSSALTGAGLVRRDACTGIADELHGIWDPPLRAAAQAAFAASALGEAADEVWQRLAPRLDEYAAAWRLARVEACHARRDGGAADELLALRERCQLRRRAELAGLTGLLAAADATTIVAAIAALDQLTPLAACDDAEGLRREQAASAAGADPDALESLRREILALKSQVRAGRARAVQGRVAALAAADPVRASPILLAEALHLRGLVEEQLGEHDAAAASHEAAVHEAIAGRHDRLHAELAVRLVWLHGVQRRSAAAGPWIAHAEAAIRALRDDPVLAARLLDHRGAIASNAHDHAAAERLHRAAIDLRAADPSPAGALDLAMSMSNLGLALLSQGRVDEAEAQMEAALARYRAAFGPHHPSVAAVLSNLGQAQVSARRLERGLALLHEALALKERSLGREHVALFTTLTSLGNAYSEAGRGAEASAQFRRALAVGERAFGPDSPRLEAIYYSLAFEAWQAGAHDELLRHGRRALELQRRLYGEHNPILAPTLELLARGQLGAGEPAAAAETIEQALAQARRGALEPRMQGSLLLSAAWIHRANQAAPDRVRALADQAAALLAAPPGPAPDQAQELGVLRAP